MRIVLGVGGGIAAYKAASLLRLFTESGHSVTVLPTVASEQFVGRATWEALSGNAIPAGIFDAVEKVNHVRLGQEADLIVVAPATADLLARAAAGLANDLLTNTLLMADSPVLLAPAMHTEMWQHPATVANVSTLRSRGVFVLEPASGRLTGVDSGPGRLPDPEDIYTAALSAIAGGEPSSSGGSVDAIAGRLSGRTVLITAGGTREPLDPVRYLGNRSSGKQGVALAEAALAAGATVRFVAAHMDVPAPSGVELTQVETALELREAVFAAAAGADVVIMAAAVADFRPAELSATKIKKRAEEDDPVLVLTRNPDILAELVQRRPAGPQDRADGSSAQPLLVGFAAETGDGQGEVLDYARQKLRSKGCDLLVLNAVGTGKVFGQDHTEVHILAPGTEQIEAVSGTKAEAAAAVLARIGVELGANA